jgi:hypothetical protein
VAALLAHVESLLDAARVPRNTVIGPVSGGARQKGVRTPRIGLGALPDPTARRRTSRSWRSWPFG